MSATDNLLKLAQGQLEEKQAELEEKVGPLAEEIKELEKMVKKFNKSGSTSSGPSVTEEDLIAAVAHCSKNGDGASSKDIAKFLGTDTRKIARQLSSYATAGKISGNKDDGYTA